MPFLSPEIYPPAGDAVAISSTVATDPLADAARYAVLSRMAATLRHEVAGSMQPVLLVLLVPLVRDRRLQVTDPDLAAIAKTVKSLDALTLATELSVSALVPVNDIADDSATAPQSFLRSVFMSALLAFCDQHVGGGTLEVTFQKDAARSQPAGQLRLRLRPSDAGRSAKFPAVVHKPRLIGWHDVQALAASCGVRMARGWRNAGWPTLDLPNHQARRRKTASTKPTCIRAKTAKPCAGRRGAQTKRRPLKLKWSGQNLDGYGAVAPVPQLQAAHAPR